MRALALKDAEDADFDAGLEVARESIGIGGCCREAGLSLR